MADVDAEYSFSDTGGTSSEDQSGEPWSEPGPAAAVTRSATITRPARAVGASPRPQARTVKVIARPHDGGIAPEGEIV